jgi:CDP-glucose 4,6-dehydratase
LEGLVIENSFWKNRNVFITGHTGFKGGWLSIWLNQLGANVTGYSLKPLQDESFFYKASVKNFLFNSVFGDIRDLNTFKKTMQLSKPSIVIHLAAQPLVIDSYNDPLTSYSTNVMGTVNMLESAREVPSLDAIINVTTDKCYENNGSLIGYKETDPMGGHDPYSCSKGCSELISSSFLKSFFDNLGVGLATARAGNVIGGGDWAQNRIVPDAMKAFNSKEKLIVRNPNSVRPWQHVLEPLSGYLMLCEQLVHDPKKYSGAWNFGANDNDAKSVAYIADTISNNWGLDAGWRQENNDHHHEANYLKLDCTKAKNILNWSPKWSLETALKETVEWYKKFYNNEDISNFTIEQIQKYHTYE